jgi:glycosyltransferase involved in cell wall biosynthesis
MITRRAVWVSTGLDTRGGVSSYVKQLQQTPLWTSWNIRHIATHRDGSSRAKLWAFGHGAGSVLWELAVRRPSLLHLHMASYGSFARKSLLAWAGWLWRVPVVIHVHGAEFDLFFQRCPAVLRSYITATLNRASVVVALGDTWARRLALIAPRARITVVPNAVRPQEQVTQPREGVPVGVLFLGNIGDRKGAFTLIDAWSLMSATWDGEAVAGLVLAGDGEVSRARDRVVQLGLRESVRVVGWAAPADVNQLIRHAQVLVLPSRSEGQPMAVLEAMANGLCVVVTNVGGIPDLVDPGCAVLVPVDDTHALATALTSVVEDHEKRSRLGAEALRRVRERFDVEVTSGAIDSLYQEITGVLS